MCQLCVNFLWHDEFFSLGRPWDGSAPVMMRVEAVGRWYESRVSHVTGGSHGGGGGGAGVGDSSSDEDSEDSSGSAGRGDEGDDDAVVNPLLLDPTQWKVSEITFLQLVPFSLRFNVQH